jgi:hypothetical protein
MSGEEEEGREILRDQLEYSDIEVLAAVERGEVASGNSDGSLTTGAGRGNQRTAEAGNSDGSLTTGAGRGNQRTAEAGNSDGSLTTGAGRGNQRTVEAGSTHVAPVGPTVAGHS